MFFVFVDVAPKGREPLGFLFLCFCLIWCRGSVEKILFLREGRMTDRVLCAMCAHERLIFAVLCAMCACESDGKLCLPLCAHQQYVSSFYVK